MLIKGVIKTKNLAEDFGILDPQSFASLEEEEPEEPEEVSGQGCNLGSGYKKMIPGYSLKKKMLKKYSGGPQMVTKRLQKAEKRINKKYNRKKDVYQQALALLG